tara:strand:- start:119 stop:1276 length:1158 start_codon:yes stop_codon:yes gene_type:complete
MATTDIFFTKKVEILRALVRTEGQFINEFRSLNKRVPFCASGDYKDIDLKLMEEFKKVFSLGTNQLEKFITILNEAAPTSTPPQPEPTVIDGKEYKYKLDVYSILYYISLLMHGPYERATRGIIGIADGVENITVEVFKPTPDIMGINADFATTNSSTPVFGGISLDLPGEIAVKSPSILLQLLGGAKATTQGLFNSNIGSAVDSDNTLPFIDKNNPQRRGDEMNEGRSKVNPAHGNLMVKDIEKIQIHKDAAKGILEEIEEYLGDKAFQLYVFKKLINYFNQDQNRAESIDNILKRTLNYMQQTFEEEEEEDCEKKGAGGEEILEIKETEVGTDMFGQTFDSTTRREFVFKTTGDNGTNEFKLYTVKGQLGSGKEVKEDPMEGC